MCVGHKNGLDNISGEAKGIGKALKKFDFVYCLLMMNEVMMITEFLSQAFQKKDVDILNAMELLSITKGKLQAMRDNGLGDLIIKVEVFCRSHDIVILDMSSPYKKSVRENEFNITNEHYYGINILYAVIDLQLKELDSRFSESSRELLILSVLLNPRNDFRAFKAEEVCKLAQKFYPSDFSSYDMDALALECNFFIASMKKDETFTKLTSVSDLCRLLMESKKSLFYPMIYRLLCLILTLLVSTATTERALSSMNIIKNNLRKIMNEEFLDDLMVLYVERTFTTCIKDDDVISEFEMSRPHWVKFS